MKSLSLLQKRYVIDSQTNPYQIWGRSIKSSLCDYSDAYTLVTGDITVIDVVQT